MIVLDYEILRDAIGPTPDWSYVDDSGLRYQFLLGNVDFNVNGVDLGVTWGWVTILDFAICFRFIADELAEGQLPEDSWSVLVRSHRRRRR